MLFVHYRYLNMIWCLLIQRRIRSQQKMNEIVWSARLNEKLQEEFNFDFDLPAVFIDTFHNREKPDEVDKFSQNTQKLWSFAQSKLGINWSANKSISVGR